MSQLRNVRGTKDLIDQDVLNFQFIESKVRSIANQYCYTEIRTPIIEYINVFEKNLGETTDIIGKEMYVFEDRNADKLVLKPEGTAPVVRSVISNGMTHVLPLKYYYISPMFRYERPQKGRQRQFHQVGFEYLGTNSYVSDVEIIILAVDFLQSLGISSYKILLNTLGSPENLKAYKNALVDYLKLKKDRLSEDSKNRLENNPLRVLDSKDELDKQCIANAPKILDFLSEEDKSHFDKVTSLLDSLSISYEIDPFLVRGLDYYTHTVFEIVTQDLGAQGTLLAGGRYDNLLKQMGGPNQGSVGFAAGIERLSLMINNTLTVNKAIAIIYEDKNLDSKAFELAQYIRKNTDNALNFILGKDIKTKLKRTSPEKYFAALILDGDDIKLRNLTDFSQNTVSKENVLDSLLAIKTI